MHLKPDETSLKIKNGPKTIKSGKIRLGYIRLGLVWSEKSDFSDFADFYVFFFTDY